MRRYGLFGLVLGLFLTACATNLPPVAVEQGVIFGSPSREQVAQTMAQAATRAKWQVRGRSADALDIFSRIKVMFTLPKSALRHKHTELICLQRRIGA